MKTIKYYVVSQYGQDREFVHPDNAVDAQTIRQLTGQKTITPTVRKLIGDLCGGNVVFEQVFPPAK